MKRIVPGLFFLSHLRASSFQSGCQQEGGADQNIFLGLSEPSKAAARRGAWGAAGTVRATATTVGPGAARGGVLGGRPPREGTAAVPPWGPGPSGECPGARGGGMGGGKDGKVNWGGDTHKY